MCEEIDLSIQVGVRRPKIQVHFDWTCAYIFRPFSNKRQIDEMRGMYSHQTPMGIRKGIYNA